MILWTFKLISSVRKAIAGRKHPGQLAWGVALGTLLGMIPHGNLLAVGLLLFVWMLQVNHAMVVLVAIAVSFLAPSLDPTFDALGRWCFAQPQIADHLALAWQYPLVPWTGLNNTIVMGSFLIGLASVPPLFLISFPLFRAWAPADALPVEAACADTTADTKSDMTDSAVERKLERLDAGHTSHPGAHMQSYQSGADSVSRASSTPSRPAAPTSTQDASTQDTSHQDTSHQDASSDGHQGPAAIQDRTPQEISRMPSIADDARSIPRASAPQRTLRTTRIAISGSVARPVMTTQAMIASRSSEPKAAVESYGSLANDQHKIDEALSYLLRQLRDSKDKDAA